MTATAALAKHLLDGNVISILDGFKLFGISNTPRELSRSIEQKFNVIVSRTPRKFKSRYGKVGVYTEYRLNYTDYNKDGIKKMREYVKEKSNGRNK